MPIDGVGKDWRQCYDDLWADVSVLVVDDEPVVCDLIEAVLGDTGWAVETTPTAEDAWHRIHNGSFGLLVTDKNLPGKSGIELITDIRAAGLDLPSLVITGYASADSIAGAMAAGASDYITKPFNIDRLHRRAVSIVEKRLQKRLYSHVVQDLARAANQGEDERRLVRSIGSELFAFKRQLAGRPDILLVAPDNETTRSMALALTERGQSLRVATTPEDALDVVPSDGAPVAAIVSLQLRFPATLIADLRHRDPLLGVLAASDSSHLAEALAAVEAGASDFFRPEDEGVEALVTRAHRVVSTSRRTRLYLHLIAALHRAATEQGHAVADTLWELLSEEHRGFLRHATAAPARLRPEGEVSLVELFDEHLARERRTSPRVGAERVEVWFRVAASEEPYARGRLRDVSCGGFFLHAESPLSRGMQVEAKLLLPGEPPSSAVRVTGDVVRTEVHEPDPDRLSGNGVRVGESCHALLAAFTRRLVR